MGLKHEPRAWPAPGFYLVLRENLPRHPAPPFEPDPSIQPERGLLEGTQRRKASCRPPSTVMTCPVVLLSRWLISRKYASA